MAMGEGGDNVEIEGGGEAGRNPGGSEVSNLETAVQGHAKFARACHGLVAGCTAHAQERALCVT